MRIETDKLSAIPTGLRNEAQGCEERVNRSHYFQPQRGCVICGPRRRNPVGVVTNLRVFLRVASQARQPWALIRNPVGIHRTQTPETFNTQHSTPNAQPLATWRKFNVRCWMSPNFNFSHA